MKKFILSLFAAFFCMSLSAQVSLSDLVNADTESAIAKYLKAKAVSTGEAGVDNFCAAVRTAATASQQSNVSIKALYEKLSAGGAGNEEANSVLEGLKTQVTSLVAAGKNAPAALAAAKNIKNPMKAAQAVKAVTSATSLLNTLTTQTQSQVKGMTQVVALLKEGKSIK